MVEANIRSADAIVAMGMLPGLVRKWRTIDDRAITAEARGGYISAAFGAASSSLAIIMTVSVMSVASVAAIEVGLPAEFVFAAVLCFGMMMRPMRTVLKAWEGYNEASAATTRVNLLLSQYEPSGSSLELPRPKGALGVRNVYYAPTGSQKPLLVNLTFGILPGATVGLLGAIGSGKTTLVRLMVGLQPPSRGEIRLDGAEVSKWDRDHLGAHIGYLPQEISLVNGTVAENIGRLGLFDETEIIDAATRAGVHNIILKLPQGYDTVIGDGGLRLSGGQRQLIGLARAIIGRPSFVVLDEPNSNLDGPGEAALTRCIADLKASGSTVIMVSHRPNLVQDLDRILLLRDGAIAFDGPVDKFFEASGRQPIRIVKQERVG
jgi:ABC-type protease/lipase transport system fused ATPase/permease subunit